MHIVKLPSGKAVLVFVLSVGKMLFLKEVGFLLLECSMS